MPGRRVSHRRFSYEPRFYNPEREEKLKRRIRIQSHARRRNPAGVIYFVLLLAMAVYIYLKLG
jgi:hypothetical protein